MASMARIQRLRNVPIAGPMYVNAIDGANNVKNKLK